MHNSTRRFWDILIAMTQKELRARYKHTMFGFLWLILNPLLQMAVIGFVFTFFVRSPVPHYYHHLFIGLLLWNFFSLSLTKATPSIVFERSLIKKAKFPHAVIPLSLILSNATHFFLALLLFLVPVSLLGTLSASTFHLLLIASVLLLLFTTGISLVTTALNVRFRDVHFFVQATLILWFYATPIVYSLSMLPPGVLWLWRLNPLTSIFQLFQQALLSEPGPGLGMLTANGGVIFTVAVLGVVIFQHESPFFDDWV